MKELKRSSEKQGLKYYRMKKEEDGCPPLLLSFDFDGINVEFAAYFGFLAFAATEGAFEGEQLFFEQFAALGAAEFRFNFDKSKGGALAEGAFCYDVEVGLDGFSHVAGVVADDHIDFSNAVSTVFTAVLVRYFNDLLSDWQFMHALIIKEKIVNDNKNRREIGLVFYGNR